MSFQFPSYYSREPFFTIQPVLNTRKKQLEMWIDLVLSYCRYNKVYEIDINEYIKKDHKLFYNEKINRRLSNESTKIIFEEMIEIGNGEWLDKDKNRVMVWWRKPEEWATLIYKWVLDSGQTNQVLTLWEIQKGDDTKNQEFYDLDTNVLIKSLKVLEKQSKAQVFQGTDSNLGVKFFSI
ncbi:vacuolar protein sorting 25 [Cavenderia fasciculata]|uniref:Vacuolar protein-sorting-associated protein 25 n=1 Tax=Cavenderia fasciculata TaxID=261658 RepID=F4Q4R4_CACFS|nr:vacuolar protein sorting 25 [Cavenderia fasciculata]EGG17860.1 vacuolar protein sorting 25 [Cavenderia fasciculata]|eukprot:XP_004356344.1 vacuolar protein sorting 25 [Cavenderia fasciculata]